MDSASKKAINNAGFIANLAPMIEGPEAAVLTAAAQAYRGILTWLDIKPCLDGFDGCDQGQSLIAWIKAGGTGDADLMKTWTANILDAIENLANGNVPE